MRSDHFELLLSTRFLLILLGSLVLWPQLCCAGDDDPNVDIGIAAEGFSHNLESFRFFTCKFRVTDYLCSSTSEALLGKWQSTRMQLWGEHIIDGRRERYLINCDPSVIQEAMERVVKAAASEKGGPIFGTMSCLMGDYVSDGEYKLDGGGLGSVADFYTEGHGYQPKGSFLTPLNLCQPRNLGDLLRSSVNGPAFARFEGSAKEVGRDVLVFATGESVDRITNRFYLDPERGFWPVRVENYFPKDHVKMLGLTTELRRCSSGRWFPTRQVLVMNWQDEGKASLLVRVVEVTELDVDNKPPDKAFAFVIKEGTQVKDDSRKGALYLAHKEDVVKITELERIGDYLKMAEEAYHMRLRTTAEPYRWERWFWALQGVIVGVIILYLVIRYLRRPRPA